MQPKISVIMAVYNSERYLKHAVESVLTQTFKDFELLLVDDGSTDTSGAICDDYASKDSRVRSLHKKNGGCPSARNFGLRESRGKYITFIDNDDYYTEKFLEVLVKKMDETKADIVKCGVREIRVGKKGKILFSHDATGKSEKVLTFDEFAKNYMRIKHEGYLAEVWKGLYLKSIIEENKLSFREDLKHGHEDTIFNCEYELRAKSFVFIQDVLYVHVARVGQSTSTGFHPDIVYAYLDAVELEKEITRDHKDQRDWALLFYLRKCLNYIHTLSKAEREPYNKAIREHIDFNILKTYPILTSKDLRFGMKVDLLFIRCGQPQLLFSLRDRWEKLKKMFKKTSMYQEV